MAEQDDPGKSVDPQDLDLVDDSLEDEGKDESELWSEFDAAEAADGDASPEASGDEGAEAASEATDAGDTSDTDGDAPPEDERPDGQPSGRQEGQESDPWATATPEQRAAFDAAQKKWEDRDRRLRGQISALHRQVKDLSRGKTAAPNGAAAAPEQGSETPSEGGEGFLASDDWKSFKDDYPDVAAPLEKLVSGLQAEITRQSKELDAIGADRRQTALNEQKDLLIEQHPDWQDVAADPGFETWVYEQPRHIQEAAFRNANEIVDAAEAADVVGRYKAFRSEAAGDRTRTQTPEPDNGAGNGNPRLSGRRQRQLESASGVRSSGPGRATGIPADGDPEVLWRQFDEMERRQAQRA